ncbi:MAG: hypothetical protein P8X74_05150 [Reinekea sp.]
MTSGWMQGVRACRLRRYGVTDLGAVKPNGLNKVTLLSKVAT